jgi:hypothetical protein
MHSQANNLTQKDLERGSDKNMPEATDSGWGLLKSSNTGVVCGFVSKG